MTLLDLSRILAPVGLDSFFSCYWQQRALSLQIGQSSLDQITQQVRPLDIADLVGRAKGGVQAWMSNERIPHAAFRVDAVTAEKALSLGATLYFLDVPVIGVVHGIASALGVPEHKIFASLFLTPPSGGAAWHFDANENFTFQLTGAKRW